MPICSQEKHTDWKKQPQFPLAGGTVGSSLFGHSTAVQQQSAGTWSVLEFLHSAFQLRAVMNISFNHWNCCSFCIKGLGTVSFPTQLPRRTKPKCEVNSCFRGVRCMETAEGFQCGPCPEGLTGNGVTCSDIDEVKWWLWLN